MQTSNPKKRNLSLVEGDTDIRKDGKKVHSVGLHVRLLVHQRER